MEDYKKKYEDALERAKSAIKECGNNVGRIKMIESIFPELKESEDEQHRKWILEYLYDGLRKSDEQFKDQFKSAIAWLEKQGKPEDMGEVSDGYHTFNELYYYRMLYNAAFFNRLPKDWVHKSKRHHDGEECFGGGWFIVMANLPTGQISNHYELKDWDLFQIPEKDIADEWDGHTPQEAAERLHKFLLEKQGKQSKEVTYTHEVETGNGNIKALVKEKVQSPKYKAGDWIVSKYGDLFQIKEVVAGGYKLLCPSGNEEINSFSAVDKNSHLWTIQDAKDGDVLACCDNKPFIFKGFFGLNFPNCLAAYCGVTLENQFGHCNGKTFWTNQDVKPATKEQCNLLFQKMHEAGYEWDAKKKVLNKIKMQDLVTSEDNVTKISDQDPDKLIEESYQQQADDLIDMVTEKSAWSEENNNNLRDAIVIIDRYRMETQYADIKKVCNRCIEWLKSIKELLQ